MQIFAPNVLVIGDEIFGENDVTGRPNPPAAAQKYEAEIMGLRQKITAVPFGRRWLDIVGNNPEPVIIVPCTLTNDAVTQTFANIPQHPNRLGDAQARGFSPTATGRGTPMRVKFNPAANLGWLAEGVSGEVLLVHELTHAFRGSRGRAAPVAMTNLIDPQSRMREPDLLKRFPDWEEWFAVVVENVFASESGKSFVRTNHNLLLPASATDPAYFKFWGISPLGTQTDSQKFARDYRPAVQRILQVEPELFRAMETARGWFNPVRDYVADLLRSRV